MISSFVVTLDAPPIAWSSPTMGWMFTLIEPLFVLRLLTPRPLGPPRRILPEIPPDIVDNVILYVRGGNCVSSLARSVSRPSRGKSGPGVIFILMLPEVVEIRSSATSSAGRFVAAGSGMMVTLTEPEVVRRSIRSYRWYVPLILLDVSCWVYLRLNVPGGRPGITPGGGGG